MSNRSAGLDRSYRRVHHLRESQDPAYGCVCGTIRSWGNDHGRPLPEGDVSSIAKRICAQLRQSGLLSTDEALRKECVTLRNRCGVLAREIASNMTPARGGGGEG